MNTKPSLGQTIRAARKEKGLTGNDLRNSAGINPTSLSFFELDKREPSLAQLRNMAKAMGVSALEVFGPAALGVVDGGAGRSSRQSSQGHRQRRSQSNHGRSVPDRRGAREAHGRAG